MTPTDPHRSPPFPWLARVALALVVAVLVAACSAPQGDDVQVQGAVLASVAEAYDELAASDGVDLPIEDPALATASSDGPRTVVRRVDVVRSVEIVAVAVDLQSVPNTATVDAILLVAGTAELWQMEPGAEPTRVLVGEKPIELSGAVRFDLERRGFAWFVTGVRRAPLVQGPEAADLGPWSVAPSPPVAGWRIARRSPMGGCSRRGAATPRPSCPSAPPSRCGPQVPRPTHALPGGAPRSPDWTASSRSPSSGCGSAPV